MAEDQAMKVTEKGTVVKPATIIRLNSALERYTVRKALEHRATRLADCLPGVIDGHLKRLWEGELEVCRFIIAAMDPVTADELRAEALTDDNPRGGR
jgi:hypothetical protein